MYHSGITCFSADGHERIGPTRHVFDWPLKNALFSSLLVNTKQRCATLWKCRPTFTFATQNITIDVGFECIISLITLRRVMVAREGKSAWSRLHILRHTRITYVRWCASTSWPQIPQSLGSENG